ncbi:MAG TPA: lysophospholipid acyltransferase family protein [Anaerolineales bacterium]|nr:lysophospholipid acyltransferase family protein [Anaerolineales bacterium]
MFTSDQVFRSVLKSYFGLLNRTYDVKGNTSLPAGPKIIAMNHTPGCDPLYLPFVLKETPHFLLQDGLFTIPLIGWMLNAAGQIPVHRGTKRAREAKEQACLLLRAGKTIAIFPEGKDVPWGQRIPAKTGVVRMAIETGAPIIPLGLYAPPQSLLPLKFDWQESPRSGAWQFTGKSYMRFGPAWKPVAHSDVHAQTKELMDRIYSLVAEAERESQCASHTLLSPIPR